MFERGIDNTLRQFPRVIHLVDNLGPHRLTDIAVGYDTAGGRVVQNRFELRKVVDASGLCSELGREGIGISASVNQPFRNSPSARRGDDAHWVGFTGNCIDTFPGQQVLHLVDSLGIIVDVPPAILQHESHRIGVAAGDDLCPELFECRQVRARELVV